MNDAKPLILFGGTFDPIHNGHLKIADRVFKQFQAPIIFMPTAIPNYKSKPLASNQDRLNMLELAINDNPHYAIDRFEIDQDIYSPSYKTLSHFRDKLGSTTPIYYIIGADSLVTLDSWDSWQDLFNLTNFIVLNRPGYSYEMMSRSLKNIFEARKSSNYEDLSIAYGKIYLLDFELSDISSTHIRACAKNGQNIEQYTPPAVAKYVLKHKIYKE